MQFVAPPNTPAPPPARERSIAVDPMLVTITDWGDDVAPTWTFPNSRPVGVTRNGEAMVRGPTGVSGSRKGPTLAGGEPESDAGGAVIGMSRQPAETGSSG